MLVLIKAVDMPAASIMSCTPMVVNAGPSLVRVLLSDSGSEIFFKRCRKIREQKYGTRKHMYVARHDYKHGMDFQ